MPWPPLVEGAGATFFADPFEPAVSEQPAVLLGMLRTLVPARQDPPFGGEDAHAE